MSPQKPETIASLFYDGVLQPDAWQHGMDALRTRLRAGVFHGFTLDSSGAPAPDSVGNLESFGLHAGHMAEYETHHAGNDPRLAATLRVAPGGVMLDHEHFSAREAQSNPVYADWLVPLGLKHTAGVVVRMEGSATEIISFMRPRDAPHYAADDKRLLESLIPDIARASRLRARMLDLSRRASLGLAALDTLNQCIAVVDAQCRIDHTNAAMDRLLSVAGALRIRHSQLGCADSAAHEKLRNLVASACASLRRAGAMALSESMQRLAVTVLPLQAYHAWAAPRQVPMALVVAVVPGGAEGMNQAVVADMLGLSPAEARLALLLASGKTVKDFAVIQGCTWNTARAHLANLLGKSGCRRQAELVQLLQALQVG